MDSLIQLYFFPPIVADFCLLEFTFLSGFACFHSAGAMYSDFFHVVCITLYCDLLYIQLSRSLNTALELGTIMLQFSVMTSCDSLSKSRAKVNVRSTKEHASLSSISPG